MAFKLTQSQRGTIGLVWGILMIVGLTLTPAVFANHSVLVEGEKDFDGDGFIGVDEDKDGDRIFGTIKAGLADANNNGHVTIVTSGRFIESVFITAENGIVVLEAAPGVTAVVEAFQPGDDDGNTRRENNPGIVVASNGNFPVEIRNLVSRNWTAGILVTNDARVTITNCKTDSNVNYGIRVRGNANVVITDSEINSSGYRRSGTLGQVPANPGIGISFEDHSYGAITRTTVAHSVAAGIANQTMGEVTLLDNTVFNNNPDLMGY